ncbi:MAG: acetate--CoA ligase family protein [Pirellulales bacterium]|nr:acetate--CoA ligase family protein [Pirellulales bacterium]
MARLYEYQGKQILREAGLDVPEGGVAATPEEAFAIAGRLDKPVAVKAQVWTTGRFKAGGIRFAKTPDEARQAAAELLGGRIKDFPVEKVLIEEQLELAHEFYAGIIVDASHKVRAPVLMFSTQGGVDVESVAEEHLARQAVDILEGFRLDDARRMVESLLKVEEASRLFNLPEEAGRLFYGELAQSLVSLYEVFRRCDARSAEINPLVATKDGWIVAADCRISIDDASVARHPELGITVPRESNTPPTALDVAAWKIEENDYRGISFFAQMAPDTRGGGFIGYHAIGGGGALLAADTLVRNGLKLANYAETSGNPTAAKVYRTARLVLGQPDLDGYCLLGAVIASQDQWHHAHGLLRAFRETLTDRPGFPVIVLIAGNKEEEALEILREGLSTLPVRFELFGREYIHRLDFVARRMKEMVEEYRSENRPLSLWERARVRAEENQKSESDTPYSPLSPHPNPLPKGEGTLTERYPFRTGEVIVHRQQCVGCRSLACVKACSLYGGYLYRVKNGKMILGIPLEIVPRQCTECLACEYECHLRGQGALDIMLPMDLP